MCCECWLLAGAIGSLKTELKLQESPFSPEKARDFEHSPHAEAAIQLRKWNDFAKVVGTQTLPLEHFVPLLEQCAIAVD
ncbi:MAG: hypothetical protein AAGA60_07710 [Cyanobacteria bacterium P01_E01_bin.42]